MVKFKDIDSYRGSNTPVERLHKRLNSLQFSECEGKVFFVINRTIYQRDRVKTLLVAIGIKWKSGQIVCFPLHPAKILPQLYLINAYMAARTTNLYLHMKIFFCLFIYFNNFLLSNYFTLY